MVLALTCLIPFYFEFRRSQRPDKLEAALAFMWLLVRRVVMGVLALLFAGAAWAMSRDNRLLAGALALVALVFAWWAWVGPDYDEGDFGAAAAAHRARKKRYGWR